MNIIYRNIYIDNTIIFFLSIYSKFSYILYNIINNNDYKLKYVLL